MYKKYYFILITVLLTCNTADAGEIIIAQEVNGYMISDGKAKISKPQFKITYEIDGDIITRTQVYDVKYNKIIPDNTKYLIQRQLLSDPTKQMSTSGVVVIRAIGQPGSNAIEVLTIDDKYVQSLKSTADYFIFSRQQRIK